MPRVELTELLAAGSHFGHITRRWNPKMKPYIFMEKNGIHIIDLKKSQILLEEAADALANVAADGRGILFVGTKKQAKEIVQAEAKRCNAYYVTERWLGGMLTNFSTVRKSVRRFSNIEKMESDGTFENLPKKERLMLSREKEKLQKVLGGVVEMSRLPSAVFIVDIKKDHLAVNEANRLHIPVFAIVDTNCDPDLVDYLVPANDDAAKSIQLITQKIADAVLEGAARSKDHTLVPTDDEVDQAVAEKEESFEDEN
jgi:small subunit ribosomal protein S2